MTAGDHSTLPLKTLRSRSRDQFPETIDLPKASDLIYKKAVALYRANGNEAWVVKAGRNTVGLLL